MTQMGVLEKKERKEKPGPKKRGPKTHLRNDITTIQSVCITQGKKGFEGLREKRQRKWEPRRVGDNPDIKRRNMKKGSFFGQSKKARLSKPRQCRPGIGERKGGKKIVMFQSEKRRGLVQRHPGKISIVEKTRGENKAGNRGEKPGEPKWTGGP